MRLAMIARCRERGLGTMTWEIARHLEPAKVLVVARDHVDFVDEARFPGAHWAKLDTEGRLPAEALEWLLSDVDVLYSAETFYDERIPALAAAQGVATALHGMWEYLPHRRDPLRARPDLFLAPSVWHLDEWPKPVVHLPVPVAADRFPTRSIDRVATVVHCAGAPAKGDRAGTQLVLEAARHVTAPMRLVLASQTPLRKVVVRGACRVEVAPPAGDYWNVFADADAALLPRRYGGLSLPLQEATALGLPVLGLAREHEAGYHHAAVVHVTASRPLGLPCGPIDRATTDPRLLARTIDHLVRDRETAEAMAEESRRLARQWSWEALSGRWRAVLGSLVGECAPSTS